MSGGRGKEGAVGGVGWGAAGAPGGFNVRGEINGWICSCWNSMGRRRKRENN